MLNLRKKFSNIKSPHEALAILPALIMAGIVGLVSVGYARLFEYALRFFQNTFESKPFFLFIFAPLGFLISWALVFYIAPGGAGSGIPQVMGVLGTEGQERRYFIDRNLSLKVVVVKIFSSIFALLSGGAIGREGPTIQIGSALFLRGIRFFSRFIKVNHKLMNDETAVLTGAAAGLAAAFNTPLGGIVFAVEELAKKNLRDFLSATILSVIIAGFAAQVISGSYLYLGIPSIHNPSLTFIPIYIVVAGCIGLCGALFGRILFEILKLRTSLQWRRWPWIFPIISGLLVAFIFIYLSKSIAGPGIEDARLILLQKKVTTLSEVFVRFWGPLFSYAAGGAGGIFSPSLSAGATLGSAFVQFAHFEDLRGLFGLIGMVSFLTGLTRAPLTAFVLVYEMSDIRVEALPILLAAFSAYIFSKAIGHHSFYEMAAQKMLEDARRELKD